jgi:hypothetical protein
MALSTWLISWPRSAIATIAMITIRAMSSAYSVRSCPSSRRSNLSHSITFPPFFVFAELVDRKAVLFQVLAQHPEAVGAMAVWHTEVLAKHGHPTEALRNREKPGESADNIAYDQMLNVKGW